MLLLILLTFPALEAYKKYYRAGIHDSHIADTEISIAKAGPWKRSAKPLPAFVGTYTHNSLIPDTISCGNVIPRRRPVVESGPENGA